MYTLNILYAGKGQVTSIDRAIEDCVVKNGGYRSDGGGCGFDGRDLDFPCDSEVQARILANKLMEEFPFLVTGIWKRK